MAKSRSPDKDIGVVEVTKGNTYRPTAAEKKLLEVLINPANIELSVTKLCNLANISRKKYYDAMSKEEFRELVNATTLDLIKGKASNVLNATYLHSLGEKGHQDRKLLLIMMGLYTEKQQVEHSGKINDPYEGLSSEELRKLIAMQHD